MSTTPNNMPAINERYDYPIKYPTSDGRPMGETDIHRQCMFDLIEMLKLFYEGKRVYVSGNLLICYVPGSRRKHVSPDVFVVKDIDPHPRDNYLLWEEGKGPNVVIEVTSASTRKEDTKSKYELYRDVLKVAEYFLFDPRSEFLNPPLQGFHLSNGQYVPIRLIEGRIPSDELELHLESQGSQLRFWHPGMKQWIPTSDEARRSAEQERQRLEVKIKQLERELNSLRGATPRNE